MKEIKGELWDFYEQPGHVVCITTNGFVKKNGEAVMGRGCAFEATQRIPGIAKLLGAYLTKFGNQPGRPSAVDLPAAILYPDLVFFPVKHNWWEEADPKLIILSAVWLANHANLHPEKVFVLPRPGCGNGRLTWEQVEPLLVGLPDNVLVITR